MMLLVLPQEYSDALCWQIRCCTVLNIRQCNVLGWLMSRELRTMTNKHKLHC